MLVNIIRILCVTVVAVLLAACARPVASGHKLKKAVPQTLKKEILADAEADIRGIEKIAEDPAGLAQYLDGQALKDMSTEMSVNNSKGKVKRRHYENIKLRLSYYSKGVAGVVYEFDDASYYTKHGDTGKRSLAIADKRRLALALAKRDGRWKIISILKPAAGPGQ